MPATATTAWDTPMLSILTRKVSNMNFVQLQNALIAGDASGATTDELINAEYRYTTLVSQGGIYEKAYRRLLQQVQRELVRRYN